MWAENDEKRGYRKVDASVYWPLTLGPMFLLVVSAHFGLWAAEPPKDIILPYDHTFLGLFDFAWLVSLTLFLGVTMFYSIMQFSKSRYRE